MSSDTELLRLYLADPAGAAEKFTDDKLQVLLDTHDGDVNAAAADGWRVKAANVADWYQVTIDGSFLSREQVWEHCMRMAEHFEGLGGGSIINVKMDSEFVIDETIAEFS